PRRHARGAAIIEAAPGLAIADPTIGWINAAFHLMRRFEDVEYPRRILTPVLILAAGADRLVDTSAVEQFASRLKAGKCITLAHACHEILMERDVFREQFWAAFDAFLPGADLPGADLPGASLFGESATDGLDLAGAPLQDLPGTAGFRSVKPHAPASALQLKTIML